jgi:DNA-binding MarR family transcriptional regulator
MDELLDEPLGRQLSITGRVVRDRFDGCLGHHGSSLATWAVLRTADAEPGLSQRELAARMSIESPTLVRHLDRMEHDGLIARSRDEHDRRVVRVSLTPAGREQFRQLRGVAASVDAQLRSLLNAREIKTLEQVLPRIRERWHPDPTPDRR